MSLSAGLSTGLTPGGVTLIREIYVKPSVEKRTQFSPEQAMESQQLCPSGASEFIVGEKRFGNGLQSSVIDLSVNNGVVNGTLAPTDYKEMHAYGQLEKKLGLSSPDIEAFRRQHSPDMANTWVLGFAKVAGNWHLVGQLKAANVHGGGQVHPALAAGAVSGKLITAGAQINDVLLANIKKEMGEEGAPLDALRKSLRPVFVLDERFQGSVVFGFVGKTDLDSVSAALEAKIPQLVEKREVAGYASYPLSGNRLFINVEDLLKTDSSTLALQPVKSIMIDPEGGSLKRGMIEGAHARPGMRPLMKFLDNPEQLRHFMELAGC